MSKKGEWPEFTADEKWLLIARLARGKSKLGWRAAQEEPAIDKLMDLLDRLTAIKGEEDAGD